MAYTHEQLAALEAAIAQGVHRVKYADKEVEYRSLADMRSTAREMRQALGVTTRVSGRQYASHDKGLA